MRPRSTPLLSLLVFLLFLRPLSAQEHRVVVAPNVHFLKTVAEAPPHWVQPGLVDAWGFSGTLRFARELSAEEIGEVEHMGTTFNRRSHDGPAWDVDHVGTIYPARIGFEALDSLSQYHLLVQVESEYVLKPISPLNITVPQTGAPEFSDSLEMESEVRPGEGIKIADIDSGIDVFHPAFFHADGGYYAWIDVDGNGELTLGTDAVDLDGNGSASTDETLKFHDVAMVNMYDFNGLVVGDLEEVLKPDGIYQYDIDWLYADSNGSGERDFGPEGGYDDSAPAMGEPVFLIDDVDGSGTLDVNEKLVRLGSSKIKKALVLEEEYVYGENLSQLTSDVFPVSHSGVPTSMHGTGVAGILAANTPGLNRFVGLTPYADLYMIDSSKDSSGIGGIDGTVPKLVWAKQQKVDIVLFEFSSWGQTFMDGSSNLELAIDQLFQKNGIMQVVPAGNLADSGKHMQTELATGTAQFTVNIPENVEGYDFYAYETPVLILSLYWPGDASDIELEVAVPEGGGYVKIPDYQPQPKALGFGMSVVSYSSMSVVGFTHRLVYVLDDAQEAVIQGDWKWKVTNNSGGKLPFHAYINDTASGWDRTIQFDKWESSATTICHPSTANHALSVAAYGGEFGTAEELGRVRDYSSRGPRMDGFQVIDVAAPDDPYTPLARMKTGLMMGLLDVRAGYTVFGGTSGAGPHVAAGVALIKQMGPELTASELFDLITKGATVEAFMGSVPNKEYGHGKLNIYKSYFGYVPPGNLPPSADLEMSWRNGLYATLDASASTDPEAGPLMSRWDFDYDGTWDSQWMEGLTLEFGYPGPGTHTAKVAVRDAPGAIDHAIVSFEVLDDYDPNKKPPVTVVDDVIEGVDAAVAPDGDGGSSPMIVEDDVGGGGKKGGGGGCSTGGPAGGVRFFCLVVLLLAVGLSVRTRRRSV